MCIKYTCSTCGELDWDRCDAAWEVGLHGKRCEHQQTSEQQKKCSLCHIVDRVIKKLAILVYQEPWRSADAPQPESWETEGLSEVTNSSTTSQCSSNILPWGNLNNDDEDAIITTSD